MRMTVIYHGGCVDGFAAAWAVRHVLPDARFVPALHGTEPPWEDIDGREVILVDFSYPRAVLEEVARRARDYLILDHHVSAQEDLAGFPKAVFDVKRSGAGLAWDEFALPHCCGPRPWIINYVEDRDLWRWELPDSRELNAFIGTLPLDDFSAWDAVRNLGIGAAERLGEGALAYQRAWAREMADAVVRRLSIELPDGRRFSGIPVANCTPKGGSELMELVTPGVPFGAYWFRRADGVIQYGLRSEPNGVDVSEIARMFGGGGHVHAAGFQVDHVLWEGM